MSIPLDKRSDFSIRINCVSRTRVNGMIQYVGFLNPAHIDRLLKIKPYDEQDGKGYQRPVSQRRTKALADYLSHQQAVILPPILLNAAGNWEYVPDTTGSDMGSLICTGPASIIDGQHRIEGIKRFLDQYNTEIRIPFCAIHNLDSFEEIDTFLVVNTTARPIDKSHLHYLNRERDDASWIATQMATDERSPFRGITTLTGNRQRNRGIHVTLRNLVKMVTILQTRLAHLKLSKHDMFELMLTYFSEVKTVFPEQWSDAKHYALTQIVVLNALTIVLAQMVGTNEESGTVDMYAIQQMAKDMTGFHWERERFKELSGPNGAEKISMDLMGHMMRTQRQKPVR